MQNERPTCRTKVRELTGLRLGHRHRANLPAPGVFSHFNKVYAGLVSFSLSGVRNDLALDAGFAASHRVVTADFDREYDRRCG